MNELCCWVCVSALALIGGACEAGPAWHQPLLPDSTGGWMAAGPARVWNRSNIFDYIDGAGELYLAYDFREVAAREYKKPGEPKITAEVYRMSSPQDAYGVFSAEQSIKPPPSGFSRIGKDRDYAAGLLRFWKGGYFVRILADRETNASKSAILALGQTISKQITGRSDYPSLLRELPKTGLITRGIRYFHKHTILNYQFYLSDSNILDLSEKTDAALAQYKVGAHTLRFLLARYPTASAASAALAYFERAYFKGASPKGSGPRIEQVEHGQYTGARRDGRMLRFVFEAASNDQCEKLLTADR